MEKELGVETFDENQFGFIKGKSTIHEMTKVSRYAELSSEKQRYGAMIALYVRNAFNSLKWDSIMKETRHRL